mgnify:CR=1 FL=1
MAVAFQFILEAEKMGIDDIEYSKDGKHTKKIVICNYERLHYFNSEDFVCVVLDESSILKNFDGKIKNILVTSLRLFKSKKTYISPYFLWDHSIESNFEDIQIDYKEIISGDDGIKKWLEQLHYKGISIVKNAPTDKESGFDVIANISHHRETFFKTPFEVIDIPNPNNSAYTAAALRNHLDLPYYEIAPGYQFLHCLINNATGGESVAVDGFKVASYMKENFTEFFETLLETPVKFVNRDYTSNAIRVMHKPLFSLDHNNDFNDIRFSVAYMGVMDCDPDQMDKFYEAYRKLIALLHDPIFEINFTFYQFTSFMISFNCRAIGIYTNNFNAWILFF